MHSHTQTLPRITRLLKQRCALFRSSRPPHIVLSGLLGPQGLNSGPEPGTGLARGSEVWGQAPPPRGSPPPTALWGVWIISSPQGGGRARRPPASLPPPRRRWPAATPQYEVVLAARGRGAAAAAAAVAGGALREPPGEARRTRFPPARPGLEAFLLQPRGRGCATKVRGSGVPAGLSALRGARGCYLGVGGGPGGG